MAKKIFVSYKYSDALVQNLPGNPFTTARHYVDALQEMLETEDHINKGEADGEDLSAFRDEHVWTKLKDKIYDSTVTIVIISKGMKDNWVKDENQWIPWEVAYSLKEISRDGICSKSNAMLAVVLPDVLGSYSYFMTPNPGCGSITYQTQMLFSILQNNMFNRKQPDTRDCNGQVIHSGRFSYIHCVTWETLKADLGGAVNVALAIKANAADYDICKVVS
jgi:hypothetical protein